MAREGERELADVVDVDLGLVSVAQSVTDRGRQSPSSPTGRRTFRWT